MTVTTQVNIDPAKVEEGVKGVLRHLNGMPYGELLITLAESLGRTIVAASQTPIEMSQAATIITKHIIETITVGGKAKGF